MTPRAEGFRQPAEWETHAACWVAWPSHGDLWLEDLAEAREAFALMCRAISEGEQLEVLVPDAENERLAEDALRGTGARFHRIPFGDIWLRDTAPVFLARDAELASASFGFNGWGGKYVLDHDDAVSARVGAASGMRRFAFDFVFEGGSVDTDGQGTALTTAQCLLNPNRNPGMAKPELEASISDALGLDKLLWLGDGLVNDHTDGHVDNIARFIRPGVVACMRPSGQDDPNAETLEAIARQLAGMRDARGRRLEVVRIPSPGRVLGEDGRVMPASSMNFYIGNRAVIVPTYGTRYDSEAVDAVSKLFPERKTIGVSANAILTGGGAFHCITQQQPAPNQANG